MTVTLDKADILAALFMMFPGLAAFHVLMVAVGSWVFAGRARPGDVVTVLAIMTPLALWSCGLYELAHWLA